MTEYIKVIKSGPSVVVVLKGGDGSGHFGHEGRPGEVGGSSPGGGGSTGNEGEGHPIFNYISEAAKLRNLVPYNWTVPTAGSENSRKVEPHIQMNIEKHPISGKETVRVSPSGIDTYKFRSFLKEQGFTWDGNTWGFNADSTEKIDQAVRQIRRMPGMKSPSGKTLYTPPLNHPAWKTEYNSEKNGVLD